MKELGELVAVLAGFALMAFVYPPSLWLIVLGAVTLAVVVGWTIGDPATGPGALKRLMVLGVVWFDVAIASAPWVCAGYLAWRTWLAFSVAALFLAYATFLLSRLYHLYVRHRSRLIG